MKKASRYRMWATLPLLAGALALASGCGWPPGPTPPDVGALVAELDQLHEKIAASFATAHDADEAAEAESVTEQTTDTAGDEAEPTVDAAPAADAHQMLHRVGAILYTLHKLQPNSEIDPRRCQQISETADELMSAYEEIDESIHAGETPDYDAVREEIARGVSVLKDLVPKKTADKTP